MQGSRPQECKSSTPLEVKLAGGLRYSLDVNTLLDRDHITSGCPDHWFQLSQIKSLNFQAFDKYVLHKKIASFDAD